MAWLKYLKETGHVEAITESEPTIDAATYGKVEANDFNVNDEFTYYIVVTIDEADSTKYTTSAIRNAPAAADILQRLAALEAKVG